MKWIVVWSDKKQIFAATLMSRLHFGEPDSLPLLLLISSIEGKGLPNSRSSTDTPQHHSHSGVGVAGFEGGEVVRKDIHYHSPVNIEQHQSIHKMVRM